MCTSKYWEIVVQLLLLIQSCYAASPTVLMVCKYGERGSLTAICTNATTNLFKDTTYRFDHLDETLICVNCTLTHLRLGDFDISGNRIQVLNLTNSRIESIEEKTFTGLVFLEKLILSDNVINMFQVGAFHGTRRIRQLYLENALMAPLPDFVFQDLWQLKELYLKNNSLRVLEKNTFSGLENLEVLDLSYNKLKSLNESLISLKSLKVVLLNNNEISKISPLDFQGLPKLLIINLSNNLIWTLSFNFTESSNLRELNLSNNHLGNEVVKIGTFKHMDNLEILDLSLNWFKVIPPKLFQGLFNLRELHLSNNTIKEFKSGAFFGLPSLRSIDVSHNKIDKAVITGRLNLNQLHMINFCDNNIVDFDIGQFLERAPRIRYIDLRANLLNCRKRREIEALFKNESIQLVMDLKNCPELKSEDLKEIIKEVDEELEILVTTNPAITALKFIVLIIVTIALLVYIYFYLILRKKY